MKRNAITREQNIKRAKHSFARKMRRNMTEAESFFWQHVRHRKFPGYRFRRQQIIDGFIVDFYCARLKTIIEIDGEIHNFQKQYDKTRDNILKKRDLRILRFTNREIFTDINKVIKKIFN
jgi:very-short-patch-repair endonuclease